MTGDRVRDHLEHYRRATEDGEMPEGGVFPSPFVTLAYYCSGTRAHPHDERDVAEFTTMLDGTDDGRPAISATVGDLLVESARGHDESESLLAQGVLYVPAAGGTGDKVHVRCLACNRDDQVTEDYLRDALANVRDAFAAGRIETPAVRLNISTVTTTRRR